MNKALNKTFQQQQTCGMNQACAHAKSFTVPKPALVCYTEHVSTMIVPGCQHIRVCELTQQRQGSLLQVIRLMTVLLHPPVKKDLQSPICAGHWLEVAAECTAVFKGVLLFSLTQQQWIWMIQESWEDLRQQASEAAFSTTRKGGHHFVALIAGRKPESKWSH